MDRTRPGEVRRLGSCVSCPPKRPSPGSSPVNRSTFTAPRRRRPSCWMRSSLAPRTSRMSASSTSIARVPVHTCSPRWPPTSAIARCSSARMPARRSKLDGRSTSPSSCPTFRCSSTAGCSRSMPSSSTRPHPTAHGFCSLGTSVEAMHAAIRAARTVIVQFNRGMPRTLGDSFIHVSQIDLAIECDVPPYEHPVGVIGDTERRIGEHVAELIPDGSTIQLGIGAIPAAVALALRDKRDLGVHTEMFTDSIVDLVEAGVITGARKERNRGKIVTAFMMGTRRLYDFVNDNPMVEMRPVDFTNDTHVIRSFRRMAAINSAIEVDLTGQVVADSIGHRLYSGVGGQMDFIRGAGLATEGKAFIASAVHRRRRPAFADCRVAQGRRGCRHDPGTRTDGGHRVGRGRAVRAEPARTGAGAHRHRPSGLPRSAHGPGTSAPPGLAGRRPPGRVCGSGRGVAVDAGRPLRCPPCLDPRPAPGGSGRTKWPIVLGPFGVITRLPIPGRRPRPLRCPA